MIEVNLKLKIKSTSDLAFSEHDPETDEIIESDGTKEQQEEWNKLIEEALAQSLKDWFADSDFLDTLMDDENFDTIKFQNLEPIVSKFYDPEADPQAVIENMEYDITIEDQNK